KALPQVQSFEGINVKVADSHQELKEHLGKIDLITGDVSFISSRHYFSILNKFLRPGGHLVVLIKPQFELDRSHLNKKGIVTNVSDYTIVETQVRTELLANSLLLVDYFESCIVGQDGNREFFVYAKKPDS